MIINKQLLFDVRKIIVYLIDVSIWTLKKSEFFTVKMCVMLYTNIVINNV